jgi:hypothetical protein
MFDISSSDIIKLLNKGELLRVADCCVDANRQLHFEQKQKEVWNKGMADSKGMLAGVFCQNKQHNNMYLVVSLWENNASHQRYVDNKLPSLIESSGVKYAIKTITGNLIKLNQNWSVI